MVMQMIKKTIQFSSVINTYHRKRLFYHLPLLKCSHTRSFRLRIVFSMITQFGVSFDPNAKFIDFARNARVFGRFIDRFQLGFFRHMYRVIFRPMKSL